MNRERGWEVMAEMAALESAEAQLSHVEELPAREARYAEITAPMSPLLKARLEELGTSRLYSHQAAAYDLAMRGDDVAVITGTSSGKTLCYNLPALQTLLSEPNARALYFFPTKALAQDQISRLHKLSDPLHFSCATYDGDTPKSQRSAIRKTANIILTNPDMIHIGLLPQHELWIRFLKSLRLIVIDEMHAYRGVFGSHVGNVVRRLLRLCEWHRSKPQIIACSATVGNPGQLFRALTGRQASLVVDDGSPSGKRTFVFWNPPPTGGGERLSAGATTSQILVSLAAEGKSALAFSRARVGAELVLKYARQRAPAQGVDPAQLESYRAGYTAKERRELEQKLFQGKILALSATNAMELGVDVGGLDAVVMNGYPGTISSFWQQSGRAGRAGREGLAILVARDDPLEQHLIRNPETLLHGTTESVALSPENPHILRRHLLCAAHERPIQPTELERFGPKALDLAEDMDRAGELAFRGGFFYYPSFDDPAMKVSLRGPGATGIRLICHGEELGSMERWRAMQQAHEGAIYLHRGQSYLVESLNLEAGIAEVRPFDAPYYTQPIVQSSISPGIELSWSAAGTGRIALSGLTVTDVVTGYRKRSLDGDRILDAHSLDFPASTYDTMGIRLDLPEAPEVEDELYQAGVHGVEHALLAIAPLLAGCDRADLGSSWYEIYPDTLAPAVFIFDRAEGGVGLAERLYESKSGWIQGARQVVAGCPCLEGCPACLYLSACEAANESLNKGRTLDLLALVSGTG